jgi:hypothetical protein
MGSDPILGRARLSRHCGRCANGYALYTAAGLARITADLASMSATEREPLRDLLRLGAHADIQVTVDGAPPTQHVTQLFCSALPVAYSSLPSTRWARFATLVLEGAYEPTLLAAALNAVRTGCAVVFLTRLGGGAFGNDPTWTDAAMRRALDGVRDLALDVRVVSRGRPSADLTRLMAEFA